VADLNADVRGLSQNYRDPAGAIQQDKAAGEAKRCQSCLVLHVLATVASCVAFITASISASSMCQYMSALRVKICVYSCACSWSQGVV
jgi:hypothetical protein